MKNYRKTRTSLEKTKFLSIWAAVFVFAASLVLIGCPNQANSPAGGGESTQGSKITINYKSDELTVEKKDTASGNWTEISSGTAVDEGTRLRFEAKNVPSGNMVDKWVLNDKEKTPNSGNDLFYIVKAEDTVDEGGKKVIKVTRTFKPAASITIKYNSGEITIEKKDTASGNWTEISSDTEVDEGSDLWFIVKNKPSGKILDKWLLNGKKEVKPGYIYSIKAEDAVDEGGKKVIKVERILKDAASITINYNSDELTIKKNTDGNWIEIASGSAVDEGTRLEFGAKNIPSGKTVDKWLLNGETTIATGSDYCFYTVKAEDADSANIITVTRILKDAASITINYNSDELTVKNTKTWTEVASGTAVDEGTRLSFEAKNIPPGKILDKWVLNNGKKEVKPGYSYSIKTEDAVEEGGKKVIKVERILKDAALITINYNSDELTVKKNTDGNWTEIPSGTAVYEGTELWLNAKNIPSGKTVDKWLLNGETTIATGSDYCFYTVKAEDADSANTITITRKLKDAALITINYNPDELGVKDTNGFVIINPGEAVYEGSYLAFTAKNIPPGKMIVKWKINSKEFPSNNFDGWYSVNAEDADSANTVTVTRILKDAASITINYNSDELTVKKLIPDVPSVEVPSGTAVDEGSLLGFEPKDGHSVTKWILNGKTEVGPHVAYQVDSKDAVDEGDKKVIRVTFE
ncbi:hypothetical protein [Treponema denticola]|uniref:hypothetical protein n=1 Tax=Treponema denticola TaxID=158 RepID=UPI002102BA0C|nr:hypothetical protein [Treponema denticola]UTY23734.1 hypothetical protein E4N78_06040 [Treponema denticola]